MDGVTLYEEEDPRQVHTLKEEQHARRSWALVGAGTKAGLVPRQSRAWSEAGLYEEYCSRRSLTLVGMTTEKQTLS
jgi:hypothetical protein